MRTLAKKLAALLLVTAILASSAPSAFADTNLDLGGIAIVAHTGGDSVMIREGAGTDFAAVASVPEGAAVTVLSGPYDDADGNYWYEIDADGTHGLIAAQFLALPGNEYSVSASTVSSGGGGGGGYVSTITGTGGDGARMRDGASIGAAIILTIPENEAVTVLDGPLSSGGYAWYPISYAGYTGYVAGDFLGNGSSVPVEAQTTSSNVPSFERGAHVQVGGTGGDDLRIRDQYGLDSDIVGHAPPGAVLAIQGGPFWDSAGNGWYAVDFDGVSGYSAAGYLTWTGAELSARQILAPVEAAPAPAPAAPAVQPLSAPAPAPAAAPDPPASTSHGQAIVNVAMRYLGFPYVYAGASPSGFDCSGFTMYVTNLALGINIGRTVGAQFGMGTPVNSKSLEPGDLVFFADTYDPGLSHVGIYIGGGQMIHAGSERTGVVISNVFDAYWGAHYVGARRI